MTELPVLPLVVAAAVLRMGDNAEFIQTCSSSTYLDFPAPSAGRFPLLPTEQGAEVRAILCLTLRSHGEKVFFRINLSISKIN